MVQLKMVDNKMVRLEKVGQPNGASKNGGITKWWTTKCILAENVFAIVFVFVFGFHFAIAIVKHKCFAIVSVFAFSQKGNVFVSKWPN